MKGHPEGLYAGGDAYEEKDADHIIVGYDAGSVFDDCAYKSLRE